MRDIDELLVDVLPKAPSCPEPIAVQYLREAAIELATKARNWKETDTVSFAAPDYEQLVPFQDARILAIEAAWFEGQKLQPIDTSALDDLLPNWQDAEAAGGTPRYLTQLRPDTLSVAPRAIGVLKLRCILVPSAKATSLPDFMIDHHGIDIGKGALGRILTHPQAEWANPQLGGLYLGEFQAILARAHHKALKGQQNAPLRTKASLF